MCKVAEQDQVRLEWEKEEEENEKRFEEGRIILQNGQSSPTLFLTQLTIRVQVGNKNVSNVARLLTTADKTVL